MEPQKRAKYSKPLEQDEIEEVRMDEESDKELEETDELIELRVQSSLSQKMKIIPRKPKFRFGTRRAGVSSNVFDFTGPPKGVNRSAASVINAESCPLFILHSLL